jgi:hypothetical protein
MRVTELAIYITKLGIPIPGFKNELFKGKNPRISHVTHFRTLLLMRMVGCASEYIYKHLIKFQNINIIRV